MRLYGVNVLRCILDHDEELPTQAELIKQRDEARRLAEEWRYEATRVRGLKDWFDDAKEYRLPWEVEKP